MLPVSFQLPAGLLLVLAGVVSCFAGYRLFRVVLGIFGFIVGWLFVSSAMGTEQTLWMLLAAFGGGLAGALILIAAYFVGVALIGAGVGAGAASVIWASFGREPGLVPVIVLAILGALGALALQRYVIIVATAFGGAQTTVVGAAAILGNRAAAESAARTVYSVYPLDPMPGTSMDAGASLILGIAGVLGQ